MRYKFFNTVIHQGLRGWGWRGGERHEEREGLRNVLAPFWFILKDSVAISTIATQNKKCLQIIKKNLQGSNLQRGICWLFFTLGHFPKIYPNQLLWLSWQLGKYGMGIMSCEAGCLVPPWDVKGGVNEALLQHHILLANSEKKTRWLRHCLC